MNREPIFDAFREFMGGSLTQAETDKLDAFLDQFRPREKADAFTGRKTSAEGIALIKRFEGCELRAYPDPSTGGKPWTIGIGTTVYPSGQAVKPGDVITEAQAEDYLRHDLARFEAAVNKLAPKTTRSQFDALVSLAYNVGETNLSKSTLLKLHNEGDHGGAALQFGRWNKAAGKILAGLTRRRAAEAALYRRGP